MQAGDAVGDGQAQAAMALTTPGDIQPLKGLQGDRPGRRGDTGPPIPHLDLKTARIGLGGAQHQPQGWRPVLEGVLQQVAHRPGQGRGPHPPLQGLEIQLQRHLSHQGGDLSQQVVEGHDNRRLGLLRTGKQQELIGDPLQSVQVGGAAVVIRLRQNLGGGGQIEAQAQAGEGGAQVVGHAGEHGGAFTPAPLQPLHHRVEAGGEAAHGRAAPGRQGKGAGLVETHLSQGQLQPPQGALYLQGEIEQTGTQATAP